MGSFFDWVIGDGVAKYNGRLAVGKNSLQGLQVTTIAVAGNKTLVAADIVGGMLIYDPTGGAASLTFPTAVLLVAELGDAAIKGAMFEFRLRHTGATTAEDITFVAGVGNTLSPATLVVAGDEMMTFMVRLDDVSAGNEAVTYYGTGLHLLTT